MCMLDQQQLSHHKLSTITHTPCFLTLWPAQLLSLVLHRPLAPTLPLPSLAAVASLLTGAPATSLSS